MDPFTEKLLERTRARRENLQRKMAERPTAANRPMAKRTREPLTDTNSVISEPTIEKALPSSKPSPSKRRCSDENTFLSGEENKQPMALQMTASEPMTDKKPPLVPSTKEAQKDAPTPGLSNVRSRLQRLAKERHNWDSEGTSETVPENVVLSPLKSHKVDLPTATPTNSELPVGRKGRLANLAATIGSWEDDLGHPPTRRDNAQAQPGTACVHPPVSTVTSNSTKPIYSPVKSTRVVPPSPQKTEFPQPRLAQAGPSPVSSPLKIYPSTQPSSPLKSLTASPSSPHRGCVSQSPLKNQGPSKLNSGAALNSSPAKPILTPKPSSTADVSVIHQTRERFTKDTTPLQHRVGVKSFLERFGERCQERNQNSPSALGGQGHTPVATPSATPKSRLLQERLGCTQTTSTTAVLTQKQKMEREAELAQIRNRFQKGNKLRSKEDLSEVKNDPENKVCYHVFYEVREIEMNVDDSVNSEMINELFDGVLDESEEQSDEEDADEDALNISSMSLLAPLAETVAAVVKSPERKHMVSPKDVSPLLKKTSDHSVSRPSKFQRTRMLRAGSSDGIDVVDEQQNQNLLYSIDAYRSTRIKTESERPHVKQVIVRKEDVSQRMETNGSSSHINIKQKMKTLTNEMNLQQTVIHQASQALNCCTDEEHGKGSQVEAEAERLLLIATERRAALKAELDRLKAEGPTAQKKSTSSAQVDMGIPASKGSISLLELQLPLKADFICSSANKPGESVSECGNHYFFVMIRAGAENTVATTLASTRTGLSGDALTFSTRFTLSDVSNDFEIDIEVYCFVQKRELNPDKRKKLNPGGPNAVRTSSFVLVGSHKLTLASIGKNKFPLEKVPFLCPLEGHVYLKMQCEVGSRIEERGFLTMFEDVSGFGAWHRRWCVLSGYCISFWTYPDDEKRKNPIGRINLSNCTSRKVEPANREFCARPNTFELITVRPQREDDRETLVSQCKDTLCVTKNWLSADTKDERNLWMQKLNQVLIDLRTWQPDSCYKPM
uniref:Anillin n=1 Tax=Sinocyclocheilus rhinocerous TaxID=307959 RepID=A0A673K0G5_9TELE